VGPAPAVRAPVVVPMVAQWASVNPLYATDAYGQAVVRLAYPSLWWPGPHHRGLADLARAIRLARDGQEATILLRRGRRWSDGRPITAVDVAVTLRAMADGRDHSPYGPLLSAVAFVRAVSRYTVQVGLRAPDPTLWQVLPYLPIAPGWLVGPWIGHPRALQAALARPVVSGGPFWVKTFQPTAQEVVLVPAATWPVPLSRPHRLVLRYENTSQDAWQAFLHGDLSLTGVPQEDVGEARSLSARLGFHLVRVRGSAYLVVAFNLLSPVWRSAALRRAAVEALPAAILGAPGAYPPPWPGSPPLAWPAPRPREALGLLDALGWKATGSQALRQKGGKLLSLTLVTVGGVDAWTQRVHALAASLRRVGILVKVRVLKFRSLVTLLTSPQPLPSWVDAYALAISPDPFSGAGSLWAGPAAYPPRGPDAGRYRDPTVMRLLEKGWHMPAKARRTVASSLARALAQDPPFLACAPQTSDIAVWPSAWTFYRDLGVALGWGPQVWP
jgi:peptide/nickel transport system substrate-binding protein